MNELVKIQKGLINLSIMAKQNMVTTYMFKQLDADLSSYKEVFSLLFSFRSGSVPQPFCLILQQ